MLQISARHIPTTTANTPTSAVILCQPIAPVEGSVKIKATEVATNPTSISNMPIQVKISLIVSSLFFIFSFVFNYLFIVYSVRRKDSNPHTCVYTHTYRPHTPHSTHVQPRVLFKVNTCGHNTSPTCVRYYYIPQ